MARAVRLICCVSFLLYGSLPLRAATSRVDGVHGSDLAREAHPVHSTTLPANNLAAPNATTLPQGLSVLAGSEPITFPANTTIDAHVVSGLEIVGNTSPSVATIGHAGHALGKTDARTEQPAAAYLDHLNTLVNKLHNLKGSPTEVNAAIGKALQEIKHGRSPSAVFEETPVSPSHTSTTLTPAPNVEADFRTVADHLNSQVSMIQESFQAVPVHLTKALETRVSDESTHTKSLEASFQELRAIHLNAVHLSNLVTTGYDAFFKQFKIRRAIRHNINNQLTVILSIEYMLRSSVAEVVSRIFADPHSNTTLNDASFSITRTTEINDLATTSIRDLLGKLGGTVINLKKENVDLRAMIENVAEHLGAAAAKKSITLTLPFQQDPVRVHADPLIREAILFNLLENAINYTPNGGQITLSVKINKRRRTATLYVRDNGKGISKSKKVRSRLFTEGYREPGSETYATGTGTGLDFAQSVAMAHGADSRIKVKSAGRGKGSEFSVTFPLAQPSDVNDPKATSLPVKTKSSRPYGKRVA